jgi:Tfp pilus assembly protein PilF
MADALEAGSLRGRGRPADALALLEGQAGQGGDAAAMAELVRRQVEAGETGAAQRYLEGVLAADAGNLPAQLLLAGVAAIAGDPAAAEARYRALIAAAPRLADAYQALATLQAGEGEPAAAAATLEAGLREAERDIAGAIDDYAALYARDSAATVVANNLASLLSAAGETQDIDRAFAIARRLRDTDQPHFQDTYGWILHLRGASGRALDYLVPASEALPDMAQVWLHRGEAELALGRRIEARASFTRALEAAEAGSPLPEAAALRERLSELADPDPADPGREG